MAFVLLDAQDGCQQEVPLSKRTIPPTGGGPPIISASSISRPTSTTDATTAPLALTLTMSGDAERAGRAIVALVRDACRAEADDNAVDRLATLEFFFKDVTRRVPEFHAFMDELVAAERLDDVARIIGEPKRRGRPRKFPSVIALIEMVRSDHPEYSVTQAIGWIDKELRGKQYADMPSVARMRNIHSEFHELFELWDGSRFVPADILTAWPWSAPSEVERIRSQFAKSHVTRLRNAMVVHDPADKVSDGENASDNPTTTEE